MISKDEIVMKIEALKKEVKSWEIVLRTLERQGLGERVGTAMRFYQVRPQLAIYQVLQEKGPLSQEALTHDLVTDRIAIGKKRGVHNVRISIEKQLRQNSLKQLNGLIGKTEWPDSKFV